MGCSASSPSEGCSPDGFHERYLLGKKLCGCRFGEVYVATAVRTTKHRFAGAPSLNNGMRADRQEFHTCPTEVGVKIIDLQLGPRVAKLVTHEVARWKKLGGHENILQLYEVIHSSQLCYMVMEAVGSSLIDHLNDIPILNERVLSETFAQMLLALKFLHLNLLVHRDINPDAFTVGGSDGCTLKLGDFGNAATLRSENDKLKGECGTATYMAPEMLAGLGYNEKVDIWSLGVLVYIFLFGRRPFNAKGSDSGFDMKLAVSNGTPTFSPPIELSCSAVAFAMLLLDKRPSNRPSAKDALRKSYIASAREGTNETDADLPCLKFTLMRARQIKAFDHTNDGGIDGLLNRMQVEAFGIPLPNRSTSGIESVKSHKSSTSNGSGRTTKNQKHMKRVNPTPSKEWCHASSSMSKASTGSMPTMSLDTDSYLSSMPSTFDDASCQIEV